MQALGYQIAPPSWTMTRFQGFLGSFALASAAAGVGAAGGTAGMTSDEAAAALANNENTSHPTMTLLVPSLLAALGCIAFLPLGVVAGFNTADTCSVVDNIALFSCTAFATVQMGVLLIPTFFCAVSALCVYKAVEPFWALYSFYNKRIKAGNAFAQPSSSRSGSVASSQQQRPWASEPLLPHSSAASAAASAAVPAASAAAGSGVNNNSSSVNSSARYGSSSDASSSESSSSGSSSSSSSSSINSNSSTTAAGGGSTNQSFLGARFAAWRRSRTEARLAAAAAAESASAVADATGGGRLTAAVGAPVASAVTVRTAPEDVGIETGEVRTRPYCSNYRFVFVVIMATVTLMVLAVTIMVEITQIALSQGPSSNCNCIVRYILC